MQLANHVSSAKYIESEKGQLLSAHYLASRFPDLTFLGEVQQTGLLGMHKETGDFEIFVRHPKWVPMKHADGTVEYGGPQTEEHIIHLLGRTFGNRATQVAKEVLEAFSQGDVIPYSALKVGKELESVAHDRIDARIVALAKNEQLEFQSGVHEDALPPFATVEAAAFARFEQIHQRAAAHPDLLLMDTSTPLVGTPDDAGMQLNNGDGGNYIRPWAERLQHHLFFQDTEASATLQRLARAYGYADYDALLQKRGFQVLWPSVACQTSYGMPHLYDGTQQVIPLEIAIATADIFNSNLGAVADWLMASSPLMYGGRFGHVLDHRMVIRYIFDGAWPAPFIRNVAALKANWQTGGVDGLLYTIDRLAFLAKLPSRATHAMIYGSAKIRVETKEPDACLGRVESTIAGASPSLLDEIAHDALLYIFAVAALEAVAHGSQPLSYYQRQFPRISGWKQRKRLTALFNHHEAMQADVTALLAETTRFLQKMKATYPIMASLIDFVAVRINNLAQPSVRSFHEYLATPQGPISGVMVHMHDAGATPFEVLQAVHYYQATLATTLSGEEFQADFFGALLQHYGV